jgi:hypothetical protein
MGVVIPSLHLRDNLQKYEKTFGEIERKTPRGNEGNVPNPFQA